MIHPDGRGGERETILRRVKSNLQIEAPTKGEAHEAIIKFPHSQKAKIQELLENFPETRLIQSEDGRSWVHCRFEGDIKKFHQELRELQSKAMVMCGEDSGEGMPEFFIEINQWSRPQQPLNQLGKPLSWSWRVWQEKPPLFMLILAGIFILGVLWGAPRFLGLIASRMEAKQDVVGSVNPWGAPKPSWNKFVMRQYQERWLALQQEFGLSDRLMLELFKNIKNTGQYGYGQIYNDLTIYPEIMRRALGIIVLQNVHNLEDFSGLVEELRLKYLYGQTFPDEDEQEKYPTLTPEGNGIILVFYENVLFLKKEFTKILIGELMRED